ncbi:MAG: IS1634 family transposase [Nitrospirae bacterium]|nr:IS1634 family transposase [Nitrospirota bacterium]
MFLRVIKKKENGREYATLCICQSYRKEGKVKQRIVANLGSMSKIKKKEIDNIIKGLSRFTDKVTFLDLRRLENKDVKRCGDIILMREVANRAEFYDILRSNLKGSEKEFDVVQAIEEMVMNRIDDPLPKVRISEWRDSVSHPEWKGERILPHQYYRAMDELIKKKDEIEKSLFLSVCNLFDYNVNVLFYDLTSTYFEGDGPEGLSEYGYSRDHRPDRKQVVIALVITGDGIPVTHEVFKGNTADVATMEGMIEKLKKKYNPEKFILVCDRGLMSRENIEKISGYRDITYIFGAKRWTREAKDLLKVRGRMVDAGNGIKAREVMVDNERSIILYFNEDKVKEDREGRESMLHKIEEDLEGLSKMVEKGRIRGGNQVFEKVGTIFSDTGMRRFFTISYDEERGVFRFRRNKQAIKETERLDGKFFITTNDTAMSFEEVLKHYRNLNEIEMAFRNIKDTIELRPIRHWTPDRVRAHVLICYLAHFLMKVLDRYLREKRLDVTSRRALYKVSRLYMIEDEIEGIKVKRITRPDEEEKAILKALDIPLDYETEVSLDRS